MFKELNLARKIWPLIYPYRWKASIIIALGTLASLTEGIGISLMIPLLQSVGEDTFQMEEKTGLLETIERPFQGLPPEQRLVFIALAITGAVILKSALAYLNKVVFSQLNQQIGHQLRSRIFSQLLYVHYTHIEKKDSGELLNLIASESWQVSRALEMLVNILTSTCTLIVFTVFLLILSWQLMLIVSVLMILVSVIVQYVTRRAKLLGQQAVQVNSSLATLMCEGLMGMRTIRAFGREEYEQKRFSDRSSKVQDVFWKLDLLYGSVDPLHEGLSTIVVISVLVVSLIYDPTSLPAILTFMFMLYRLQPHIKLIDAYRVNFITTGGAVDAVMEFTEGYGLPDSSKGYVPYSKLQREIKFDRVSFQYTTNGIPALQEISLTIPKGKTTALVGPSGAGKSTLINLICRFYDATKGEILVDQYPIQQLSIQDWRERIALVSQDIYIFSSTVQKNIAYGRLDATDDEIITAAKQANAHEFICKLDAGYETPVGDRGIRLSGGQRQRIALARAIVRNPDILILDEATNALDTLSEHLIQEALEKFSHDRTVIVIAHRLSTIEQADQIVVLDQGRIAEQGSLSELLANQGLFNHLYQLQYRHALPNS